MTLQYIFISALIGMNLLALLFIAHDKRKSIRGNGKKRTPEGILFFLAAFFGAFGVYLGMQLFRHKTRKWYFQLGIPLLILQNAATIYLVSTYAP